MSASSCLARLCCLAPLALLAACGGGHAVRTERTVPTASPRTEPAAPRPMAKKPAQKTGGGYYLDDGPGDNPPDLAAIPDAAPRKEPLRRAANNPYSVMGQDFVPLKSLSPYSVQGVGSWYGRKFHGQATASGERYDMYGMTAAHPLLPIPSYARVTNLENGKAVVVRVNDRGPFLNGRLIDLSYTAAWKLGYADRGSARLQVDLIVPGEGGVLALAPKPVQVGSAAGNGPASDEDPIAAFARADSPPADAAPAAEAAPAPPPPAASVPAVAGKGGVYLQLGAFSARGNADSLRDHLQRELPWLAEPMKVVEGAGKYRLHLGPYASAAEAAKVASRLAESLGVKPFVVR